ncbi:MarR family winged helix-turn-helix transcriptional regulator [Camelimonas fluminis]|uniref:MarR family winged helix-turn-helix transcriptional regulator n=1 Tax=Camelimonas fluminis TaxID=1576911 RepID=A0ABV7UNK1_9HYPH|nr:MarR family transcriptional regulator [Camelimonas fluminis]
MTDATPVDARLPARSRFGAMFVGLARRWRAAIDASLAGLDLTDATLGPLAQIARCGDGVSQKELAAAVGVGGSTLVRLLDILVARGLVERQQDRADRRANLLYLTPAGRAALRRIETILASVEDEMLADMDEDALESLTRALEKIDARIAAAACAGPAHGASRRRA